MTWWQALLVVFGLAVCISPLVYAYSWFMLDIHRMNREAEQRLEEGFEDEK